MRKTILIASLLLAAGASHAQQWAREPTLRVCENIVSCDDERDIELTEQEVAYVESLLRGIRPAASEKEVTAHFGAAAVRRTTPAAGTLKRWRGPVHRVTWSTDGSSSYGPGPHVDVYFIDDQAYSLTWWFNGMRKSVRLTFVE